MLLAGCEEGSLSSNLDGKACGAHGECVTGYVCDAGTNLCVAAGAGVTPACREGETVCDGRCVVLATDSSHCGGCGATCTAPENAEPACAKGECKFTCVDPFVPCGDGCRRSHDFCPEACGACGNACPMPDNGAPLCTDGACGVACDDPLSQELPRRVCRYEATDPGNCGDCDNACDSGKVWRPSGHAAACLRSAASWRAAGPASIRRSPGRTVVLAARVARCRPTEHEPAKRVAAAWCVTKASRPAARAAPTRKATRTTAVTATPPATAPKTAARNAVQGTAISLARPVSRAATTPARTHKRAPPTAAAATTPARRTKSAWQAPAKMSAPSPSSRATALARTCRAMRPTVAPVSTGAPPRATGVPPAPTARATSRATTATPPVTARASVSMT